MRLALLSVFFISFLQVNSTEITGRNKEYAGKSISFYKYTDPVTLEKEPVFTIDLDALGYFKTTANIDKTIFTFSEFGIYRGNLFLEPGQNIELLLPPRREKSFAEEKNPYFSPIEFWFATRQGTLLNDKISALDNLLNKLTDKHFNQLYYNRSRSAFDSVQVNLQKQLPDAESKTYQQHKNRRLKSIEADALRLNAESITPELLNSSSSEWTHPSFIQLFEKAFAGKLSYEVKVSGENALPKAISKGDIHVLHNFAEQTYGTKGALTALALLKMLHDGYYSGEFNRERILTLLNHTYFTANSNREIPVITKNILQKLMHLRKGSQAPEICLKNINGHRTCTSEDNDKYKYLLFADTEMKVVREQLKYLNRVNELFNQHLEIYVILQKSDLIEMKKFLIEENIPGIHLVDENNTYTDQYRIKSFPTALLLNSKHEVVFEEARAPLDGFEQQFGTFLRNELFMQQRNQSR